MDSPSPAFRIIIPARYGATRLPGKPLLEIGGKPLIRLVYEQARQTAATEILVATDDERIAAACRAFAAPVILTRPEHPSGSDRLAEVIRRLDWPGDTLVVNLQGDEPCMPPALVDQVAASLAAQPGLAWRPWPIPSQTPRPFSTPRWSRS
jgi:3-deoxy-manno-octulosonate cytidylyltransferase (CMP-KDO synthetase)